MSNRLAPRGLLLPVLIPLLAGLAACSDEDRIAPPFVDQGGDGGGGEQTVSISGRVVDHTGAPLTGVQVTVGERFGFSDDSGQFLVAGLDASATIARFGKGPRINTNYRALSLTPGSELTFPEVAMLPLARGAVFFASESATVDLDGLGSGAVFADSSFVDAGQLYLDRVGAFMALARADQADFAAAFPGEFRGRREDGAEVTLDALGVIWTLIDSQAGPLSLAPDTMVTYRLAVDPAGGPSPATVGFWVLDVATGTWQEAGSADLQAGAYVATVASLGPVCWGEPVPEPCEVAGVVQDAAGQPLAGANVVYRDLAGRFRAASQSRDDGSFRLLVPRHARAVVTPYFGGITGSADTVSTAEDCPATLPAPLRVVLPDYRIDLTWTAGYGDLDAHYLILVPGSGGDLGLQWALDHVDRGRVDAPPFTAHLGDAREGGGPESILGRRWYEGRTEYWVHDYETGTTDGLLTSGATVSLTINEQDWSFAVADAAFDADTSDSTGWWHVFDVEVAGTAVTVQFVQRFEPGPDR